MAHHWEEKLSPIHAKKVRKTNTLKKEDPKELTS